MNRDLTSFDIGMSHSKPNFVHDPGPLHLPGIRAANPQAMTRWLVELSSTGNLIVADLTLGAWRHFQVASDIFAQMGARATTIMLADSRQQALLDPALPPRSRVSQRIDRETWGDRVALDAYRLTGEAMRALAGISTATLCVLPSSQGGAWEPADELFVRFLTQALQSTAHRVLLGWCGCENPELPGDWIVSWSDVPSGGNPTPVDDPDSLLHLVPGVITADVARLIDPTALGVRSLIPMSSGCFLVPPHFRRAQGNPPREQYDRLAVTASHVSWLAAYASYWGSDSAINPALLWEYGRSLFDAGGLNIAIRLLERAIGASRTPTERAVFEILLQGARILSRRFEDAAGMSLQQHLAPDLHGWLWFTRGWALTMLEKAAEAEPCLERARDLLLRENGDKDEYLYVLNISALNRLKLGDWDGAFALEQQIRSALDRVATGRWQIAYINSLNLARLYRRRGDSDAAEQRYLEAFSTSYGAWSDSDMLYLCVCLAKLYEARRQYRDALYAWVRAALYWGSCMVPEAIGSRVTNAIVGSQPQGAESNRIDGVSIALTLQILANAKAAGLEQEYLAMEYAGSRRAPTFIRPPSSAERASYSGIWHAIPVAGCWVFGLEERIAPVVDTQASRRLRQVTAALMSLESTSELSLVQTIVADDRLGCGLPEREADMLAACLRLGIPVVQVASNCISLGGAAGEQARARLQVRLASIVSNIIEGRDGVGVTFKRYLEPQKLSGKAADALRLIGGLSEGDLRDSPSTDSSNFDMSLLRQLERERIVDIFLPEDITVAALRDL